MIDKTCIRFLMMMLTAASLASACAKTDRIPDGTAAEIVVSPIDESLVRGVGTKSPVEYPSEGVFGLYAYHSDCAGGTVWDSDGAWPDAVPYFSDAPFRKNGVAWGGYDLTISDAKPYYWPFSGSMMFAGYSPHRDVSEGTISEVDLERNIFARGDVNPYLRILFTQNSDPDKMVDLMWFDVKDVAAGRSLSKTSDAVDVLFKHALSKVSFDFKDARKAYKLKDVVLQGCVNKAEFYSGKTPGWMPVIDALTEYTLLTNETLLHGWMSPDLYIIPQYLDGVFPVVGSGANDTGEDVKLVFKLTGPDGYGEETIEILLYDHTEHWILGHHYRYTVTVEADPIDFGAPMVTITTQTASI